jgi:hypothetical protein
MEARTHLESLDVTLQVVALAVVLALHVLVAAQHAAALRQSTGG